MKRLLIPGLLAAALIGCAGQQTGTADCENPKDCAGDVPPKRVLKTAEKEFEAALASLQKHSGAWKASECDSVADGFLTAAELFERARKPRQRGSARYNAVIAYQRCKMAEKAKPILVGLLEQNPAFHRARAQLAMLRYAETGEINPAVSELERAIKDAKFQNADALVSLAMLQMRRHSPAKDEQGHDDMERARRNLQRALAVDDSHMPALNQLAIYYLQSASGSATQPTLVVANQSTKATPADLPTLELAALVCSQALRKDPKYAPLHNTAGLVHSELGDLSAAARSFATARGLDPTFFEAHMNYAAVNLQFRGFVEAQKAYEAALRLRPKSYDARIGLALALRGQLGKGKDAEILARTQKLLKQAKEADRDRPEAYFNEAILLQEFRAAGLPPEEALPVLAEARRLFGEFIARAKDKPELAEALARAKDRVRDIDEVVSFMKQ